MRISDWSSDVCSSDVRDFRQAATIDVPTRAIIENEAQPESLMPDPFALSVTFHVKPEHAEEFGARVKENVSETRKDEGRSEEHTSELQSLMRISYAVFCLKKQK